MPLKLRGGRVDFVYVQVSYGVYAGRWRPTAIAPQLYRHKSQANNNATAN